MQLLNSTRKFLLLLFLAFIALFSMTHTTYAAKNSKETDKILKSAFKNNIPVATKDISSQNVEVIFDSRYDTEEIIRPKSAPSSYDYYKTYRTGVTCKGSGSASSYLLNANITFYINVFFKSTNAVGYETPVVTGVSGVYGATGYSNPSVKVSSWSAHKMTFKGTCKLTAGGTYTMTGSKSITLP